MSWYGAATTPPESDEDLRARLLYVAGDPDIAPEVRRATGSHLDDIASRYNLRRR